MELVFLFRHGELTGQEVPSAEIWVVPKGKGCGGDLPSVKVIGNQQ